MATRAACFEISAQVLLVFVVFSCLTCPGIESHDALKYDSFATGTHIHDEPVVAVKKAETRYLLYEVNHGEGFNLRRDVYMRIANLVKNLNEHESWTLVLPPWSRIYHWKSRVEQTRIPWRTFFDIDSLRKHVPVIEMEEFLEEEGPVIEETHYLQRYKEGWNGKWVQKMDHKPCVDKNYYKKEKDEDIWRGWFWGYGDVIATKNFRCLSIQGHASFLKKYLLEETKSRSVFLDRAETVLHDHFSDRTFWEARRSMVFNPELTAIGDAFRKDVLNSDDVKDQTERTEWWNMKKTHGSAKGGDYLSVHLRRADYLWGHDKHVPSLKGAADQIRALLTKLNLDTVFVATDAPDTEYGELRSHLTPDFSVHKYRPDDEMFQKFKDGGVAIVDQWIAAHARYFIGTHVSTFSFRIQEEREIMGFDPETTFNCLCPDAVPNCEQPSKWKIVY